MAYRVFLSHATADKASAVQIARCALEIGIEVYLFEWDPKPGALVSDKLKQAIDNADAIVVLLTPTSQTSAYTHQEIGYAERSKKLIVPMVLPGFDPKHLAMLVGREYVNFDPIRPDEGLVLLRAFLANKKNVKEEEQRRLAGLGILVLLVCLGAAASSD